ncbi:MAG: FtsX-like permease family protein [Bacteroidota bacterium]
MIRNYFKVALRSLTRQKGSTFLNITGLAIGLAAAALIFFYLQNELTYDTMHPAPEQTFGIGIEVTNPQGETQSYSTIPSGLTAVLQEQLPEQAIDVLRYYQVRWPFSMKNPERDDIITSGDGKVFFVEDTYSDIMYFPLLQGNKEEVLTHPNSVVLSAEAAQRLFGTTQVLGRQLEMKHRMVSPEYMSLEITGVMEDYPDNVHMRPKFLISMPTLNTYFQQSRGVSINEALSTFGYLSTPTYIRVSDNTSVGQVEAALSQVLEERYKDQAYRVVTFLTNIADFHYDEQIDWSWWNRSADYSYILIFGSIGLMILFIACINYMNLATAKSEKRSREVGVRRALGSSRKQLMLQFLQESVLTSFLALLVALVLMVVVLPYFNILAGKNFTIASLLRTDVLIGLGVIWLSVALLSSTYPALFLSSFKPVTALKGALSLGKKPIRFRKVLVIGQFAVSVLLLISMSIILKQVQMIQDTKLYTQADQIISIGIGPGIAPVDRYQTFKNELLKHSEIEQVALGVSLPRKPNIHPLSASLMVPELGDEVYNWKRLGGDYDFPKIFNLEVVAGRLFDPQNTTDSTNYILNETAVKALNKTPEEVIGYNLLDTTQQETGRIIGVVKDFHFESIHTSIKPTVIQGKPQPSLSVLVKLPAGQMQEKLAIVEETWKEVMTDSAFPARFLNEKFEQLYAAELSMARLVQFFAVIAIAIACLGLYGLASFTAEQKTKEIGIRKALGATVPQVLFMLVLNFMKMILIACVIALPIGYFLMQDWLQNFIYRVEMGWIVFVLCTAFIIGLTLLTVAYESIKASTINPTQALRYE